MRLASPGCWVKDQELVVHLLVNFHHSCLVTATVAIVGRTEYCDNSLLVGPVKAIHDQLVGARNQLQIVGVIEVLRNVLSKCEPGTSGRDTPTMPVIWVRPQEIAHGSFVRHFNLSIDRSNLVKGV